ncbi:hypothetical protein RFI_17890 [Reticulomyxa filosa]|uniref:Uncharacterized protein n=1 Tax=Reticulomyxa filosa TaxID=46433 RepID=X6N0S7_RETFI|nr:hypothetical protein RFI_17890 [Reticulomyxa filosa]|eukprot:ETO19339.1 hypothetical protein RFI_17890 [Reticulomyxa filosa]
MIDGIKSAQIVVLCYSLLLFVLMLIVTYGLSAVQDIIYIREETSLHALWLLGLCVTYTLIIFAVPRLQYEFAKEVVLIVLPSIFDCLLIFSGTGWVLYQRDIMRNAIYVERKAIKHSNGNSTTTGTNRLTVGTSSRHHYQPTTSILPQNWMGYLWSQKHEQLPLTDVEDQAHIEIAQDGLDESPILAKLEDVSPLQLSVEDQSPLVNDSKTTPLQNAVATTTTTITTATTVATMATTTATNVNSNTNANSNTNTNTNTNSNTNMINAIVNTNTSATVTTIGGITRVMTTAGNANANANVNANNIAGHVSQKSRSENHSRFFPFDYRQHRISPIVDVSVIDVIADAQGFEAFMDHLVNQQHLVCDKYSLQKKKKQTKVNIPQKICCT